MEVAAIDGASRMRIYYSIILPLIRPALGTVAILNLINIWNDIWFPLIFNLRENQRTLLLGVTYFWNLSDRLDKSIGGVDFVFLTDLSLVYLNVQTIYSGINCRCD